MNDVNNNNGNETSKTIFVVRHGVARHNVAAAQTGQMPNLCDPNLLDPHLIRYGEEGVQRARDLLLHHHAREQQPPKQTHVPLVDLVVTSPLTRCLQTAHILFHDRSAGPIPPFLCHDGIREAFGCHYPDKRQPKSKLQSEWPSVEFDAAMTENDEGWQPDWRESIENVTTRIREFFAWLAKRPEQRIAIVSHGVWIECMLLHYCPQVLQYGQVRVYNCDIYSGDCISVASAHNTETRLENMRKIQ